MGAAEEEPWLLVNNSFKDITIVAEGKKLLYHKAVLAQHSRLVRQLLTQDAWCRCYDVIISLDSVSAAGVKYVMDLVYSGAGGMADTGEAVADYRAVIEMLMIDTIVLGEARAEEEFNMAEFFNTISSDKTPEPVNVSSEDLFISRSASSKNKTKASLRNSNLAKGSVVDQAEVLKRLKEEKNKVGHSDGKKKTGRKRKHDLYSSDMELEESSVNNSIYTGSKVKISEMSYDSKSPEKTSIGGVKLPVVKPPDKSSTLNFGGGSNNKEVCEIVLDDNDIKKEVQIRAEDNDKYVCPYEDCQSESKNAQSIKIHLALVHYKKTIQAEFPNWKKQKCEECDRSIGQMTAYYLHMANHKKYKYMDLTPEQLKASKGKKVSVTSGRATITPNIPQPFFLDTKKSLGDSQNKSVSSPFASVNKIFTPKAKSYSPNVQSLTKSNSFVKSASTAKSPGFTQISRSASFVSGASPGLGYSAVQTGGIKFTPKGFTTSGAKGPPGPGQVIRLPGPNGSSPAGFTQRSSFTRQSLPDKASPRTISNKDSSRKHK